jgi:8-oxo-dGTP pyrophosphatase MutT (NUDIX family)
MDQIMSMNFLELIERLESRLKLPLPGASAHEAVRAVPVGSLIPKFEHKNPPKPGSVMILLYPEGDRIKFPLIKRPDYQGTHSGQVSLPGGKAEAEETVIETALRETFEEIGVHPTEVTVIGRLSDFFVIPSNFMVTPVIGYAVSKPVFTPDALEVAHILNGDVFELIKEDAIKEKEILAANRFPLRAPHFEIEGEVVWGATAMMLNELRLITREIIQS